ncbi:hypothetical protein DUI87_17773 [Hirundo rustica rustica]|uniref:R3H domain-containing protein n=1 Tax=Hirundo rustica rustica TaxID=333673 RepID=A0A3M0JY53_HIRRU|nr:hypothetical protein DUI87_17773 [Hirundo rustica rustica]
MTVIIQVDLQCECGRRKESMICSEASNTYQRIAAISIATKLTDLQLGDSVEISRLITKKEMKQARLQCDEECLALQRNRRLAEALEIDDDSDPFNVRSSGPKYSDLLKEDARRDIKFVSDIEKEMRLLVEAVNKTDMPLAKAGPIRNYGNTSVIAYLRRYQDKGGGAVLLPAREEEEEQLAPPPLGGASHNGMMECIMSLAGPYGPLSEDVPLEDGGVVKEGKHTKKSHCYPPMNRDHRRIIHELAQVYGIESVSYDNEPKRNVVITAVKSGGNSGLSKPLKEEPVIDYFDVQD